MALSDWFFNFGDNSAVGRLRRFLELGFSSNLFGDLFVRSNITEIFSLLRQDGFDIPKIHALHAAATPNRLSLADDHRSLTYEMANREIEQLASGLRQRFGLGDGDFGMIMMENRNEYILTWFAMLRLGVSTVHASYGMKPDELEYQLNHSESELIVASKTSIDSVRAVTADRDIPVVTVGVDPDRSNEVSYRSVLSDELEESASEANGETSTRNVIYTSGTTGNPKGTVREVDNDDGGSTLLGLVKRVNCRAGDRGLITSPIYHGWGQLSTMIHTLLGATIYLRPKFDARDTLDHLWRWNINTVFLVPIMVRRILNLPDELHEQRRLESLRSLIVSGAPFPQPLKQRAVERFGPDTMHEVYAASELGAITHLTGHEMLEHPGSSGTALPGVDLMIADEEGQPLPKGEVGSIYVSHEDTMEGYLKDDEANEEIQHENWMTLDDLGYLDEDGHLHITGRSRDMVISGGVNVYPVEVEAVLEEHEAVNKIAVFGVEDQEWGERLIATVVPAEGHRLDEENLEDFAEEHLHAAKVPKQWHTVEDLPTTSTGKVLKRELEERFADSDGSSGETSESEEEPAGAETSEAPS